MTVTFFCPGIPKPGGSKTAYRNKYSGKTVVVDACKKNKEWRAAVALFGNQAMAGRPPMTGPLRVTFQFAMPFRKEDLRKDGTVKRIVAHTTTPDVTKLTRSTEDALTGIVWKDDAQICKTEAVKHYGETPGCRICVEQL